MLIYLSNNLELAMEVTELALDELESIVGRFTARSSRAGQLRGKVVVSRKGNIQIRHHFTNKLLWEKEDE